MPLSKWGRKVGDIHEHMRMENGRQLAPSADYSGRGVKAELRPMHVAQF